MKRRLTIRSKLAAALAVPLLALAAVVAVQVRESVGATDTSEVQADLATAAIGPGGIVTALQNERNFEALRVIGWETAVELPVANADDAHAATDVALQSFRISLETLDPEASAVYLAAMDEVVVGLDGLREQSDELGQTPSLDQAEAASALFGDYTTLVEEVLDANDQVPVGIDDAQLRTGVELLGALSRQAEIEARLIREALVAGVLDDERAALETRRLTGVRDANERQVQNLAVDAYGPAVIAVLNSPERAVYVDALDATAADPLNTELDALLGAVPASEAAQLRAAQDSVSEIVRERADEQRGRAASQRQLYIALAIALVFFALLVLVLANRWITRPLKRLADEAVAMANDRLPAAVSSILETPPGEDVALPEFDPIRVRGGAEVAGAVDALNAVQENAISLAVEQAVLRRNIADSFVNLGRRNQNLLARQLELITVLETEESDPENLEQLFQLDHLATRMRRNAESLLVLAGEEPARQWSAPVAIGDVLRASLGEVEQFSRVRLHTVDQASIAGNAVADLSHIVAELLENALSFSPPDATVDVYARRTEVGFVVTIVDTGIGLSSEDIERSNRRLDAAESFTIAPSRYLGHYVVARLAARHLIRVELAPSPAGGISASLLLPPTVIADGSSTAAAAPMPVVEVRAPEAFDYEPPVVLGEPDRLFDFEAVTAAGPAEPVAAEPEPEREPEFEPEPAPVVAVAPAVESVFAQLAQTPEPEPQPEPEPEPEAELVVAAEPPSPPPPSVGAFAALLHAPAPARKAAPEPAAEVFAPEPEREAHAPAAEPEPAIPVTATEYTFLAAPIQDDLLPRQAPRRGRRGRGAVDTPPQELPPQVMRIAASVRPSETESEVAAVTPAAPASVAPTPASETAATAPEPAAPAPAEPVAATSAPPLPRRPIDTEAADLPPLPEPEPAPARDLPKPNYELFAAFRAASDQGRADAVGHGSDGGTK